MSWANTILSTTSSIAKHESEINELAGYKSVTGIKGDGTETISFVESGATQIDITLSSSTIKTSTLTDNIYTPLLAEEIVSIEINEGTDLDYIGTVITCNEGNGITLYDSSSNAIAVLSDILLWSFPIKSTRSWNDKITTAKLEIGNSIKQMMVGRGHNEVVIVNSGYAMLDIITNPEVFALASDYYTLMKVYRDLWGGGSNEIYKDKHDQYRADYQRQLDIALEIAQIDPSYSGTAVDNARTEMGIVI